jgi:hypothetical protein
MSSWRGAQLKKKHRDNFTFPLRNFHLGDIRDDTPYAQCSILIQVGFQQITKALLNQDHKKLMICNKSNVLTV